MVLVEGQVGGRVYGGGEGRERRAGRARRVGLGALERQERLTLGECLSEARAHRRLALRAALGRVDERAERPGGDALRGGGHRLRGAAARHHADKAVASGLWLARAAKQLGRRRPAAERTARLPRKALGAERDLDVEFGERLESAEDGGGAVCAVGLRRRPVEDALAVGDEVKAAALLGRDEAGLDDVLGRLGGDREGHRRAVARRR